MGNRIRDLILTTTICIRMRTIFCLVFVTVLFSLAIGKTYLVETVDKNSQTPDDVSNTADYRLTREWRSSDEIRSPPDDVSNTADYRLTREWRSSDEIRSTSDGNDEVHTPEVDLLE